MSYLDQMAPSNDLSLTLKPLGKPDRSQSQVFKYILYLKWRENGTIERSRLRNFLFKSLKERPEQALKKQSIREPVLMFLKIKNLTLAVIS